MTERLAESNQSMHELQAALVQAQLQAAQVVRRADSAESAPAAALVRVAELERPLDVLREAQASQAAAAQTDLFGEPTPGSVEELMEFDERVAHASGKNAGDEAQSVKLA